MNAQSRGRRAGCQRPAHLARALTRSSQTPRVATMGYMEAVIPEGPVVAREEGWASSRMGLGRDGVKLGGRVNRC